MRLKTAVMLILMIFFVSSCASRSIKFDPGFKKWTKDGETRACMTLEKVIELKHLLIDAEYY